MSVKFLDSAKANIKGNLATTLNKYRRGTTSISEDVYKEVYDFASVACLYEKMKREDGISEIEKQKIREDEREFLKSQIIFNQAAKKKAQN